jgi:hypothetical protein
MVKEGEKLSDNPRLRVKGYRPATLAESAEIPWEDQE